MNDVELFYQKFLMRFAFLIAFLSFIGVFIYAYYTEVSINLPEDKAPFEETFGSPLQSDNTSLERPHLTEKELKNWLSMAVSEALTFGRQDFGLVRENTLPYFTTAGRSALDSYLKDSGILASMSNNQYKLGIFIESPPLLLTSQEMEGVYRWLFQMPITLTFTPENQTGFGTDSKMVNQPISFRVQIRRTPKSENSDGIQIEAITVSGR